MAFPCAASPASDELLAWLHFTLVPEVRARERWALLRALGPPRAIFSRPPGDWAAIAGERCAAALARGPQARQLQETLEWLARPGHGLLAFDDPEFPAPLRHIPDPPFALYVRGRAELLGMPIVAIVGSRNATALGVRDAEAFARGLSDAGVCVASGLALGVDAAAHRGGLAGPGGSVAVLGTGADVDYPRGNRELAARLASEGCIVSEFPLGVAPDARNFPRRNRLISGLARGVVVVEAAMRSGSLITAHEAARQGRDVFAIPGSIHSPLARGCHRLIKEGAMLAESPQDVLLELGIGHAPAAPAREPERSDGEREPLLRAMGFAPASADQIAQRAGLDASQVAVELTRLEFEGRIDALPGGWFQRRVRASRDAAGPP